MARLVDFCRRWKVTEMSLFGAILRDDFRPDSDVDILVSFSKDVHHSVFELAEMRSELTAIFEREVDLLEKEALRNPFRKRAILRHREVIYAG